MGRIKRQKNHFIEKTQRQRAGFKSLYKNNKQQPTTNRHIFFKNPSEIGFFLQVAQFIFKILGEVHQFAKGPGGRMGVVAIKMKERTSLLLRASEYFCTQSDPAVP